MKPDTTSPRVVMLGTVIAAVLTSGAHAGPCSPDIERVQTRIDAKLRALATIGQSAPESTGALIHRQPTPGSVAAAEEKLGDVSAKSIEIGRQAMARARAADSADDKSACEQALADAERVLGQ